MRPFPSLAGQKCKPSKDGPEQPFLYTFFIHFMTLEVGTPRGLYSPRTEKSVHDIFSSILGFWSRNAGNWLENWFQQEFRLNHEFSWTSDSICGEGSRTWFFQKSANFSRTRLFLCDLLYFIDKTHNFTHLYMLGLLPRLCFLWDTSIFLKFANLSDFTKIAKKLTD